MPLYFKKFQLRNDWDESIIAIDSFKGSISSIKESEAISLGIQEVYEDADIISLPLLLSDGGEAPMSLDEAI